MNLQDNLITLQRQNKQGIILRLCELLLFSVTACFINDNQSLYRCFYSAIFIYTQGILIYSYYHCLLVKYSYNLRRNQNSGVILYLLNNVNPEELNRGIQFYHIYFYLMKLIYWIFELIFVLFVPFEIFGVLQQSSNYLNCLILFELILHFLRRFYLIIWPLMRFFILFYQMIHPLTRYNFNTQQQIEALRIEIVPENAQLECIICLENIENEFVRLKCSENHIYHEQCIKDWLKLNPTCPKCRKEI